jgi:hypothetical protein
MRIKLYLFDIQFKYNDKNLIHQKSWLDFEKFKKLFSCFLDQVQYKAHLIEELEYSVLNDLIE